MTTIPHCLSAVELFERQTDRSPAAHAVSYGSERVTYAELDARANRLARFLRARAVGPDALVAIAIDRSIDMAVAVLGVLKAGGGYVPIDPSYPQERLAFMLEDTRAPLLLTTSALQGALPQGRAEVIALDGWAAHLAQESPARLEPVAKPEHLAYVIFTSGSTGKPKGVAMPRGPLDNLIDWQLRSSGVGAGERTLQFAPLSFDVHFQEMFATWAAGGELVLVDDSLRLEAVKLLALLEERTVARLFLPYVALQNLADVAAALKRVPSSLREVITAGEQLVVTKSLVRFFEQLPGCTLYNHYGPSETHVVTSFTCEGPPASWAALPPIGKPIDGATVHLLDEGMRPVPAGSEGELYLGGVCVARGYLHRAELTAAKFVHDPFSSVPGALLYRTGDLGRALADGDLEFLGRLDGQVKVRGYRIELGEIEVALGAHPAVRQAVVIAREDDPGDKRLVAYVACNAKEPNLSSVLRRHLAGTVPDYMVPSAFVEVADFPRTPSGKIDRRALPRPEGKRPELETSYVAPGTELQSVLCRMWASLIKIDRVGVLDNFFDLGGNSLLALQASARLQTERRIDVPVVQLFANPTVRELAAYLEGAGKKRLRVRAPRGAQTGVDAVAIVGMAGRFPGAANLDELWNVLAEGRDTTSALSVAELDPLVPSAQAADPAYVMRRGLLAGADCFDAGFFGMSPKEAEITDPQQRIALEVAWEALENAGYAPETVTGAVGVFAGTHNNSYYVTHVLPAPDAVERIGAFTAMAANEKDYVATRIAHKLNLTGPALSIHTACSTSLVAVASACQSLLAGACDMAIAGGVAITVPQRSGHLYQEGGMLSSDGFTRPFDAKAAGTVFSDGAGMLVLKRLSDALADGDNVLAVIRGAALNNDGANKVSFTAPSVEGQATVVASAHALAGIEPRSLSYVEAHGTATPLGDPIEVEALTLAFREGTDERGFCGLGSVKSNFGHLTAAAGVAGVVKTVLALRNALLPATVHFESPNPSIDFAASPFYVVEKLTPWPRGSTPRRAGISSFGVGGTNAHVIVEEAPEPPPSSPSRPRQLLLLSARTPAALEAASQNLRAFLERSPDVDLADVAYTLHTGRRAFSNRRYLVAADVGDACGLLAKPDPRRCATRATDRRDPPVVFLFPGQGSQYVGMGASLMRDEPLFRLVLDECAERLSPHLGRDLRAALYPGDFESVEAADALRRTELTQSALFVVEYALARLWMSWGVHPALMIGHSVGEFVCAVIAGVMSLEDALALVAARGKLMQSLPPGMMLSVRQPAAQIAPRLSGELAVASTNGPSLCVVAGPSDQVTSLQQSLEAEGVVCKPLHTSHAFHSPMMQPAVEPFAALVRGVKLAAPEIPIMSTLTGALLSAQQATDPMYWARHLRETVRFAEAVAEAWKEPGRVLLEVGPRTTLATLARQQATDRARQIAISSLGDSAQGEVEWTALLAAVGQLWLTGVAVDSSMFFAHEKRRKTQLPSYPFERKRHWLDRPTTGAPALPVSAVPVSAVRQSAIVPSSFEVSSEKAIRMQPTRKAGIIVQLKELFEEASGIDFTSSDPATTFLELGLDSLFLTQIAMSLKKRFGVAIGFRQLLEDLSNLDRLADHLVSVLPPDAAPAARALAQVAPVMQSGSIAMPGPVPVMLASSAAPGSVQHLVEQQLRLMQQQLELLRGGALATPMLAVAEPVAPGPTLVDAPAPVASSAEPASNQLKSSGNGAAAPSLYLEGDEPARVVTYDAKKAFGAIARIHTSHEELSAEQRDKLAAFTRRYNEKTKGSKAWTEQHRAELADPRVVNGFRPAIKELIYQIVAVRSSGSRIWDIDGNEYIDALNGFGSNFLGHAPKVVTDALKAQIDVGYEIGPMQPVVGDSARLVCELTGHDRAAFCNTGSEAVMGAMRIARTVTGRSTIALFSSSYHGIFDEVIVRGTKRLRSVPAAPGILPESVENVLVLDYGTPESLAILKERADDLAAIMVEPVQSRRPDFRPVEFLRELRGLTEKAGCAYIWDEVITGFRVHPGGAQAVFGVKADIATYGKVAGGGMPLGIIAGKREWMDALDGGTWRFGDDSMPTVGVTYFAGTFVRHPLTMAATKATLEHLKACGPGLQETLNARTERLARGINEYLEKTGAPLKIKHFGSLWKTFYLEDHPMQDLLFCYLRDKGIHIWDGFPCFLTEAHSDADVDQIIAAYKDSVDEMIAAGFLPASAPKPKAPAPFDATRPPVPGARLGRDPNGDPAWYVPNPSEQGKYMKVET